MDLDQIIDRDGTLEGWVTYVDGFDLLLQYADRISITEIDNRCKKTVWIRHQRTEDRDENRWRKEMANYIKDWRFTVEAAQKILSLKEGTYQVGDTIDCTDKAKILLLETVTGFDLFLLDAITSLETIRDGRKEAEKKISVISSQAG